MSLPKYYTQNDISAFNPSPAALGAVGALGGHTGQRPVTSPRSCVGGNGSTGAETHVNTGRTYQLYTESPPGFEPRTFSHHSTLEIFSLLRVSMSHVTWPTGQA